MYKKFFGTVIRGLGRGKEFGFPTINIQLTNKEIHIKSGVYVVAVFIHNQTFKGMLYVGTRPTLNLQEPTIEIHILDFLEALYDQQISFKILHKIRDEFHFENIDKLIEQLHLDKETVKKYFC